MSTSRVELATLLRLLAHPVRLQLLEALAPGEECVCHLTTLVSRRQANVSQHLAALRQSGIIAERKEGLRVYYRLTDPRVLAILAAGGAKSHSRRTIENCACPQCAGRMKTVKTRTGRNRC